MRSLTVTGALVLGLAAGCLSNVVPTHRMLPTLQQQGFSAERPPNGEWYLRRSEQKPTVLLYRRKAIGETHSFYFAVRLERLEREPESSEDFAELVRKRATTTTRNEVLHYEAEPTTRQGQVCLRYVIRAIDRGSPHHPGKELAMNLYGVACRHPLWPDAVLDAFYSERALPEQLDPSLHAEGEQLLRGVTIEVAPGEPASADSRPPR